MITIYLFVSFFRNGSLNEILRYGSLIRFTAINPNVTLRILSLDQLFVTSAHGVRFLLGEILHDSQSGSSFVLWNGMLEVNVGILLLTLNKFSISHHVVFTGLLWKFLHNRKSSVLILIIGCLVDLNVVDVGLTLN